MKINLGLTPQKLSSSRARPVIQNLGPGTVYLDTDGDVDIDSGFQIVTGAVYEFPAPGGRSKGVWIMADTEDTDVRVVEMG